MEWDFIEKVQAYSEEKPEPCHVKKSKHNKTKALRMCEGVYSRRTEQRGKGGREAGDAVRNVILCLERIHIQSPLQLKTLQFLLTCSKFPHFSDRIYLMPKIRHEELGCDYQLTCTFKTIVSPVS